MCQQSPDRKDRQREKGTSLIEVLITAVILLFAMLCLGSLMLVGFHDNIQQSEIQNEALNNFSKLASTPGATQSISIPVVVTASSTSDTVSVAIEKVAGTITPDTVYQTGPVS